MMALLGATLSTVETFWDFRTSSFVKDDFIAGNSTTLTLSEITFGFIASTSGTIARVSSEANHPGIQRISTGATGSSIPALVLSANGTFSAPLPAEMFDMIWIVRLNVNDSNTRVRFGFGQGAATDPSQAGTYFEKLAADTSWYGVCRSASTETRSSAVAACDTSFHRFRVRRTNASTIGFSIDDGTEQTVTTNVPTQALLAYLHITNNAAAEAKTIDIDYFQCAVTGMTR